MEGEDHIDESTVKNRSNADIDTSAPFRSVKEAVMLFGERVLAGEIYANKLKELHNGDSEVHEHATSKLGTMTVELEQTKQNLQKARDESMLMATCLSSLQEELERTKLELQQLKEQDLLNKQVIIMEPEVDEDVKHVEDATRFELKPAETISHEKVDNFQKKKYVKFANPQSLAKILLPQGEVDAVLERHPSLRKKKKKPLIPLIGGIFSRKKGSNTSEVPTTRA